jgi:hypothetical protein
LYNPVNTWHGIGFDRFGRIIRIDLSRNGLKGFLPDVFNREGAQIVSSLKYLSLFDNEIGGDIPTSLGFLRALEYLDLSKNRFEGEVPEELGTLPELLMLALSDNRLTVLPEGIGNAPKLRTFLIAGNLLNEVPERLGNVRTLQHLDISRNRLGVIPDSYTGLSNLEILLAKRNQLAALPENIGNLSKLSNLAFNGNRIKNLPFSLLSLRNLKVLSAEENELEFDDLLPLRNLAKDVFSYAPQADINDERIENVPLRGSLTLSVVTFGSGNIYRWVKDEAEIEEYLPEMSLNFIRLRDAGIYYAKVRNPLLPDLTLHRRTITVNIDCKELYSVKINTYDATAFCDGKPSHARLFVVSPSEDFKYQWYHGSAPIALADMPTFTATDTGTYYVAATHKSGCTVFSDAIRIKPNDTEISVTVDGALMRVTSNADLVAFQWYLENVPVTNANNAEHLAYAIGNYHVKVTDEFGCEHVSEKVFVGVLGNDDFESFVWSLYPNPTRDVLKVKFERPIDGEIIVTDMLGRELSRQKVNDKEAVIYTETLPNGVYFVEVLGEKMTLRRKFVKE